MNLQNSGGTMFSKCESGEEHQPPLLDSQFHHQPMNQCKCMIQGRRTIPIQSLTHWYAMWMPSKSMLVCGVGNESGCGKQTTTDLLPSMSTIPLLFC